MNNDNETPGEDPEGDALDTLLAAADLGIFPERHPDRSRCGARAGPIP